MLIWHASTFAENPIKTVNVVAEHWPDYTNRDGSGVYFELVKAVFEPQGIQVSTQILP